VGRAEHTGPSKGLQSKWEGGLRLDDGVGKHVEVIDGVADAVPDQVAWRH
jgi:hypothetical protein